MGTKQFDNYADLITFTRASGATYLDSDGVLKTASTNIPRIEYDADGNRLGLLVEEQRTNLFPYSEDFSQWSEASGNPLVEFNQATAPDGSTTAARITADSTGEEGVFYTVNGQSGNVTTLSCFIKKDTHDYAYLRGNFDGASYANVVFNLNTGTIVVEDASVTGAIQPFGNGWYRCSITGTAGTATTSNFVVGVSDGIDHRMVGDGSQKIYIWGAQFEAGSFPTSYIPTSGSTATRAADVASIPTSAFGYNASEGTVVVEVKTSDADYDSYAWVLDGTGDTFLYSHPSGAWRMAGVGGTVAYLGSLPSSNFFKIGYTFDESGSGALIDGGSVTSVSHSQPTEVQTVRIGSTATSAAQLNGHIKRLTYYPRRLSDAQLVELTQ